jgi:hemerythrin-like domain-containing protein
MKATETLMQEHRVIERVLTALELAVEHLERGDKVDPDFFLDAADFIRGFADGCHHQKEEGVLFKAMAAAGMPTEEGPIAVMLSEHEQARVHTAMLASAAQRLRDGDATAVTSVIGAGRAYAALLREHIAKEDQVLFPMAGQVISATQLQNVERDFETVVEDEERGGVPQKYLALVEALERQVGM